MLCVNGHPHGMLTPAHTVESGVRIAQCIKQPTAQQQSWEACERLLMLSGSPRYQRPSVVPSKQSPLLRPGCLTDSNASVQPAAIHRGMNIIKNLILQDLCAAFDYIHMFICSGSIMA